jgi:hypothetical protein
MGRPIKKTFFGNFGASSGGVGGEGVASVAAVSAGVSLMTNSGVFTISAANITAPQLTGGTKPVLTFTTSSATAGTVAVVSSGTGYLSAPIVTVLGSLAGGTGSATPTATLTSTRPNAIVFNSYLTTGSSAVSNGDIIKQEASRRYLVNNSQGRGQCKLVTTSTLDVGQMNIVATDWNGSSYYVRKLTARKVVLVQSTVSTAFLVGTGVATGWTLGAATGTVVTIADTN